jgi:hypothetical protein
LPASRLFVGTGPSSYKKKNLPCRGLTNVDKHWPRWNSAIYNLYEDLNNVCDIKIRRLRWAGHIIRMEDERIAIKFLDGKFHNIRPVRKPITRRENVNRRDTFRILGIR